MCPRRARNFGKARRFSALGRRTLPANSRENLLLQAYGAIAVNGDQHENLAVWYHYQRPNSVPQQPGVAKFGSSSWPLSRTTVRQPLTQTGSLTNRAAFDNDENGSYVVHRPLPERRRNHFP